MKSTKACALAVAGERWLDVIVMLYFVAYNRIKVVGTLMRLRRKASGFANIEDLKLIVSKKDAPLQVHVQALFMRPPNICMHAHFTLN
jgi:hypothetical protein